MDAVRPTYVWATALLDGVAGDTCDPAVKICSPLNKACDDYRIVSITSPCIDAGNMQEVATIEDEVAVPPETRVASKVASLLTSEPALYSAPFTVLYAFSHDE